MQTEVTQLKQNVYQPPESKSGTNKIVIVISVVVILLVIVASILRVLTPQTISVKQTAFTQQNKDLSQTKLHSVRFTGTQIDTPATLAIATPTQESQTTEAVITALIAQYDLVAAPEVSEYWQSDEYELSKSTTSETYTFSRSYDPIVNISKKLPVANKDQAIEHASRYLRQLIPTAQLTPQPNAARAIEMSHEYIETTPELATAYEVPFAPTINNFPVFYEKESIFPFTVLIDSEDTVHKILFYPLFKTYTTLEEKTTISIEKAVQNIQAGTGSIIDVTYINEELQLSDLQDADLKTVSIEYREDDQQGLVYPFYRFTGKATTEANVSADIQIITPAIQTSTTNR